MQQSARRKSVLQSRKSLAFDLRGAGVGGGGGAGAGAGAGAGGSASASAGVGGSPGRDRSSQKEGGRHGRMTVSVRTRPLSGKEVSRGETAVVRSFCEDQVVRIHKPGRAGAVLRSEMGAQHEYQFDRIFGPDCTQAEIYEATTKAIIVDFLKGWNCTVFAYGATGAGKSHTMLGPKDDAGIIPRALVDVFKGIDRLRLEQEQEQEQEQERGNAGAGVLRDWQVNISYLEVYNETIYDLLTDKQRPLQPCEDPSDYQVKVLGLTEIHVSDVDHVLGLLNQGNERRRMESTAANQVSSRSHAVIQVKVHCSLTEPVGYGAEPGVARRLGAKPRRSIVTSTMSLIDLAGSERAAATQNRGARLREGANINKSLLALANCINALSSGGTARVKYRDSKLTHLLKSSLEGNCRLSMIANINPSNKTYEESHNTLKYANRAKDIKIKNNNPSNNRRTVRSPGQPTGAGAGDRIEELEAENQALRCRLSASSDALPLPMPPPVAVAVAASASAAAAVAGSVAGSAAAAAAAVGPSAAARGRQPQAEQRNPQRNQQQQQQQQPQQPHHDLAAMFGSFAASALQSPTPDDPLLLQAQAQAQARARAHDAGLQMAQLEARVNALQVENCTLATLAASKLDVAPSSLSLAVAQAATVAAESANEQVQSLRGLVETQKQEIERLRGQTQPLKQSEVRLPKPTSVRNKSKSSRRKSFIPCLNPLKENTRGLQGAGAGAGADPSSSFAPASSSSASASAAEAEAAKCKKPVALSAHTSASAAAAAAFLSGAHEYRSGKNSSAKGKSKSKKRLSSDGFAFGEEAPARMKQKRDHRPEAAAQEAVTPLRRAKNVAKDTDSPMSTGSHRSGRLGRLRMRSGNKPR